MTYIIGSFTIGKISDKYHKINILLVMIFLGLLGSAFLLTTSNIILVSLALILLGLFTAGTFPVCLSLLKQSLPEDKFLYAASAFNITSNLSVLSALFGTKYLTIYQSFIPGIILLFFALPALIIYKNKFSSSK